MKRSALRSWLYFAFAVMASVLVLLLAVCKYRILEHPVISTFGGKCPPTSLCLPNYAVEVEALPLHGVESNASGLTWNKETRTLFAIINHPPRVVEMSTKGEVLRSIALIGFEDTEAIEYIGDDGYIIADERKQKVISVIIDADTKAVYRERQQQLTLGMGTDDNKGIEGLAWDASKRKLYVAKERNPIHIYELTGFPPKPETTMDVVVESNQKKHGLWIKDISALDYNSRYECLLVLSEESKRILEMDMNGNLLSTMSLIAGHGLKQAVPQPEGIALDDEDTLYLLSEPNLFYVFKKRGAVDPVTEHIIK